MEHNSVLKRSKRMKSFKQNKSLYKKKHKYRQNTRRIKKKRGNLRGGYLKDYNSVVIPKIVHQIWFGGAIPSGKQYLFDSIKEVCERNGYTYKLWKEEDRTNKNFPITYPYQRDAISAGEETGQNRFAQVADFARLEIIYTYGGIYLDSNFLIKDDLLYEIQKMNLCQGKTFIGANEDPCKLDCQNNNGEKYLSNSFFAATKNNNVLKRLIDSDSLDTIDLSSTKINHTTGPYYIRKGIIDPDKDNVGLFDDTQIYPFPFSGSIREAKKNICLTKNQTSDTVQFNNNQHLLKNCLDIIPNEALAVYLVGLGGSWSIDV